jgi:hypothetical protein
MNKRLAISGTGFQRQRPEILSVYRRRFTGNKEIEIDLWGILGMCIPTWVKFSLFSRLKVILQISIVNHSGWAWPIRLQFWKGSSRGISDVCLSWLRMQKMHFKTVSLSSDFSGERAQKTAGWKLVWTFLGRCVSCSVFSSSVLNSCRPRPTRIACFVSIRVYHVHIF